MKKTKIMAGLLASASLTGTLLGGTAAFAAGEGGTGTSDARINFIADKLPEVIPPIDGEDEDGSTGVDEGVTGGEGGTDSFKLMYVPVEFDFGANEVIEVAAGDSATFEIDANNTTNPATKKVAVGDVRGTKAGWALTAKLNGKLASGAKELTGATINVDTLQANKIDQSDWSYISNPTGTPTLGSTVSIDLTETPIMTAASGSVATGQGIWEASLSNIELEIPGAEFNEKVEAGDAYEGTVVWTLSDVPVAGTETGE